MTIKQLSFIQVSVHRPSVRELPISQQPVYRLRDAGPKALSTIELLACILQTQDALHQAESLLVEFGSLGAISQASESQLVLVDGIGPATAARLKAACEL